jgi:hypothetical protein
MSMPDERSDRPSVAEAGDSWLSRGWWAGIVGIGTLVIVALTAWLVFAASGGGDKVTRDADSTTPQVNSINGNCNGQGTGNTVTCGTSNSKP